MTTGVGPLGKKTLHFQAPSDSEDDVPGPTFTPAQLLQMQSLHDILTAVPAAREPSPSFESFTNDTSFADDPWADDGEKENAPPVTPARRPPKASSMSQDVLEKAKQRISKVPRKRSMDEVLVELQT